MGLQFGEVSIIVQDGVIVQVERIDAAGGSAEANAST